MTFSLLPAISEKSATYLSSMMVIIPGVDDTENLPRDHK